MLLLICWFKKQCEISEETNTLDIHLLQSLAYTSCSFVFNQVMSAEHFEEKKQIIIIIAEKIQKSLKFVYSQVISEQKSKLNRDMGLDSFVCNSVMRSVLQILDEVTCAECFYKPPLYHDADNIVPGFQTASLVLVKCCKLESLDNI